MNKKVLFLCTGNSCRSQMAEGLANRYKGNIAQFYSAGIIAKGLDPNAVEVMKEIGIDISHQSSKTLEDLKNIQFDLVITVCGHANETCPVFPANTKKRHKGFDDPPLLAQAAESKEEALTHYRRVRDEMKSFILTIETYL